MKRINLLFITILMCAMTAVSQTAPATPQTAARVINRQVSSVEHEFVPLVEAMPADKFDFAPTNGEFKGVRTFSAMVKHVAVTNVLMATAMLEQKPPTLTDEETDNGPASVKTRAEVIQYLKDSFALLHKAADAATESNLLSPIQSPYGPNKVTRLALSISVLAHSRDHYGQLVEYLRDNGVIPPASRPKK